LEVRAGRGVTSNYKARWSIGSGHLLSFNHLEDSRLTTDIPGLAAFHVVVEPSRWSSNEHRSSDIPDMERAVKSIDRPSIRFTPGPARANARTPNGSRRVGTRSEPLSADSRAWLTPKTSLDLVHDRGLGTQRRWTHRIRLLRRYRLDVRKMPIRKAHVMPGRRHCI
jgi:hypothetical protein